MDWSAATWWWLAAGGLVAAELLVGTFYMLMLALGAAGAALAAHAGAGEPAQVFAAALVGGGATAAWYLKRGRSPRGAPAARNRDVNLDIGSKVHVEAWAADGTARVHHRGATWAARHAGPGAPAPGDHLIVSVTGSELGLAPATHG
jgi:membrane protein implicated in regulation of membrane protease activity